MKRPIEGKGWRGPKHKHSHPHGIRICPLPSTWVCSPTRKLPKPCSPEFLLEFYYKSTID